MQASSSEVTLERRTWLAHLSRAPRSFLESALEGRTVGIVGRLFMASQGSDVIGEATPEATAADTSEASATPAATTHRPTGRPRLGG